MNTTMKGAVVGTALALAAGVGVAVAPAASAATDGPQLCPPNTLYDTSNPIGTFVGDPAKTVYGASGVTLSLSSASGTTWSGTVSNATQGDISLIVIEAKDTVSASVSYSKTTTVALGGSWTVPSSQKSGWLALGSEGYHMNWSVSQENGNCTTTLLRSGTANLPAESPFIDHS